ncbi:MAG: helicase associated domain-containing protein [Gaiellaceae bacterium]
MGSAIANTDHVEWAAQQINYGAIATELHALSPGTDGKGKSHKSFVNAVSYLIGYMKANNGKTNVPHRYVVGNYALGTYINNIRQRRKKKDVPKYQVELLNKLGFWWGRNVDDK